MASVWHLTRMCPCLTSQTCHLWPDSSSKERWHPVTLLWDRHWTSKAKHSLLFLYAGTQCHRKSESHESVHLLMLLETVMPAVIHRAGLQWLSSCLRSNFSSRLSKFSICVYSPPQNPKNWCVKSLMCLLTTSCRFAFYMLPHLYIAQCIIPTLVTPRNT